MMKIIQITDLHIGSEGEDTAGVDVRANFLSILREIRYLAPDLVVLSGDLCYSKGDAKVYEWLKNQMNASRLPYRIIGGNHDDIVLMCNIFELNRQKTGDELFFAEKLGGQPILFLDTVKAACSKAQLAWLRLQLSDIQQDLIIFMHHPPTKAGALFMDTKHSFKQIEEIQAIFAMFPHRIAVFCGHYHLEKIVQVRNVTVYLTPSCILQIDPNVLEFKIDHYQIGYREIEILPEGLRSNVRYLL